MQLETEKNKLENLLSSNLLRRKEQLVQEMEELSMADHRQELEMQTAELEHLCSTINTTRSRLEGQTPLLGQASKSKACSVI